MLATSLQEGYKVDLDGDEVQNFDCWEVLRKLCLASCLMQPAVDP